MFDKIVFVNALLPSSNDIVGGLSALHVNIVRDWQSLNANGLTVVMPLPSSTLPSFIQPSKVLNSMLLIPSGMMIEAKLVQYAKAANPI